MNDVAESWPLPRRWQAQPGPQTEAITATWCPELFYGGAAGGGKSDFLLGDYLQDVPTYGAAWRGVLFRRSYPELEELIARANEVYPASGGEWLEQKKVWTWPNGAVLRMRYLERDMDVLRYQGHQYTWIGFDELTQWASLYPYKYLKTRLRSAHPVPTKRMRAAANPGGPGHSAVKDYFIDPAPMGYEPIRDPDTGTERIFIPAKLKDNLILQRNDPEYESRLKGAGSRALVRALLDGDWNAIEGAFFDGFSSKRHVVRPFTIPAEWLRFTALDWGFARPSSVGWYAVAADDTQLDDITIPRGCLVKYRELYTASAPNVGLRLDAEEVAKRIRDLEQEDETIRYRVADPAIFAEQGGPSIGERMARAGVPQRAADNARVGQSGHMGGWDQMRARLRGEADDRPMLVFFSTCDASIRTIPMLQHDRGRPEDLDTDGEDHAADETRYACMSRPYVPQIREVKPEHDELLVEVKQGKFALNMNVKELVAMKERLAKREGRHKRA